MTNHSLAHTDARDTHAVSVWENESPNALRPDEPPLAAVHPARAYPECAPSAPSNIAADRARGFGQIFGLHPQAAILTILVDLMLFGSQVISLGLLLPLGIVVAILLGYIVYRIQIKNFGDEHDAALTKALIVGLLTAIPVPLSPLLAVPTGVIGLVSLLVRRK
jgi:hypothetical protein